MTDMSRIRIVSVILASLVLLQIIFGSSAMVVHGATPIQGNAVVSPAACVAFILKHNPVPRLECSVEELVNLYFEEAGKEGIRPELALSQAILETGFFSYGGTVLPEQNNYCGLGTTSAQVKGAWFATPRDGVRAHIQHLLAYTTDRWPLNPVIDPRYELVRSMENIFAQCPTWESLNGKWAVPGHAYGEKIVYVFSRIWETHIEADSDY